MDGEKQEIEKIKTVDAKLPPPEKKKEEEKPKKILSGKELIAKDVPVEVIKNETEKKEAPVQKKAPVVESTSSKTSQKKKLPTPVLAAAAILFLAVWTLFWLVIFGYIKF